MENKSRSPRAYPSDQRPARKRQKHSGETDNTATNDNTYVAWKCRTAPRWPAILIGNGGPTPSKRSIHRRKYDATKEQKAADRLGGRVLAPHFAVAVQAVPEALQHDVQSRRQACQVQVGCGSQGSDGEEGPVRHVPVRQALAQPRLLRDDMRHTDILPSRVRRVRVRVDIVAAVVQYYGRGWVQGGTDFN